MKKVLKQVVGIDVAQDDLVVCLGKMYDDWTPVLEAHKTFANKQKGFESLIAWVAKLTESDIPVRYVMEATGVYHEPFAYFLHGQDLEVSIVLPNKISSFFRTLETKTVTDKTASEAIAVFGLEKKIDRWEPPKEIYKRIQQLSRERGQLVDESNVILNQIHAEKAGAFPDKMSIQRAEKRLALLKKQKAEIMLEINKLIKIDEEVQRNVLLICTIPGIGLLTAAIILGETNGFNLIRNKKQLTSYAGLDVREKQSGTSVKGKSSISKRGNKLLRKAMHLPALSALQRNERFKAIFIRIVSKTGLKMKGVVAIQRKLLELSFTVYKTQTPYDKDYFKRNEPIKEAENISI